MRKMVIILEWKKKEMNGKDRKKLLIGCLLIKDLNR